MAMAATSLEGLTLGRAVQGAGAISAAVTALLADQTRDAVRTKAMALVGGSIGLMFAVALVAAPVLTAHIGLAGLFGLTCALALAGVAVGVGWRISLVAGLGLALSSTAIALQVMGERNLLPTGSGQAAFSILLFQDVAAIPILALLPLLAEVASRLLSLRLDVGAGLHHRVHQRHGERLLRVAGGDVGDQRLPALGLEGLEGGGDAAHLGPFTTWPRHEGRQKNSAPDRSATVPMSLSPRPDRLTRMDWSGRMVLASFMA